MKKGSAVSMGALALLMMFGAPSALFPQAAGSVTLFSVLKHEGEERRECINFSDPNDLTGCDLRYGSSYIGEDLDWFQSSLAPDHRSVIRDLGESTWAAEVEVPVVEPFAKLKTGEQRHFTVDTSGADGVDRGSSSRPLAAGPKRDGKPIVDPVFVKAVPGHMYVIHVVDDVRDFYALVRVESLERGDNCTVSWKPIAAPTTIAWIK